MERYLITIKADDRSGLIMQITSLINRHQIIIESLNAAKTDIRTVAVISIEVTCNQRNLETLLPKLDRIIEVFSIASAKVENIICHRLAFFKLSKDYFTRSQIKLFANFHCSLINVHEDYVVVSKCGSDNVIRNLYNQLEGASLLSFSQTGLLGEQALIEDDIERVIYLMVNSEIKCILPFMQKNAA